jgi:hypothetical protein
MDKNAHVFNLFKGDAIISSGKTKTEMAEALNKIICDPAETA